MTFGSIVHGAEADSPNRPNVVLIITDDQGYGDLSCHGNPVLKTPNLDRLHADSVRLTNYHVDPTCSPTRSALMTGRYSTRTGVWHTIMGRSLMRPEEKTLADLFVGSGYHTAMFGKWHLGDNAPCRPVDFGFQHTHIHGGGGVGQTPDLWGNDYFDDRYLENGEVEQHEGYCTDIWFDEARDYIRSRVKSDADKPFFVYLSTNAPHGPYLVPDRYSEPYAKQGIKSPRDKFYGMIANIDENLGKLRADLESLGIAENTLLIFTTDNGTAAGHRNGGFNAGMRGNKGSEYEGGHRVPCFFHWPAGELTGGRDVSALTAHIDVFPTLRELCDLKPVEDRDEPIDGVSLASGLRGQSDSIPSRTLFVHSQRIENPEKWRKCAVMTDRWRLINGKELYDLPNDPGQQTNVAAEHPEVVSKLRGEYETWWDSLKPRFDEVVSIAVGSKDVSEPVLLTAHDWHSPKGAIPWNQSMIRRDPIGNGDWAIDVKTAGNYRFRLRRRPPGVDEPLNATEASIKILKQKSGQAAGAENLDPTATEAVFDGVTLSPGKHRLRTTLRRTDGKSCGAYYVVIERMK